VASVNDMTPEEARAALADAGNQASGLRRTDKQFRAILLWVAAMYLAIALLAGLFPRGGWPLVGAVFLVILVGGFAVTLLLLWRIRAWSRRGLNWFTRSAAAFSLWNIAVVAVSHFTGWWGPQQSEFNFLISAAIAVLPLLIAAWLVGRWR
jgi:hypothetical protein